MDYMAPERLLNLITHSLTTLLSYTSHAMPFIILVTYLFPGLYTKHMSDLLAMEIP